jgi:hypothetical protein
MTSDTANTVEGKMLTAERLAEFDEMLALGTLCGAGTYDEIAGYVIDLRGHITALQCLVTRLEGERDEARALIDDIKTILADREFSHSVRITSAAFAINVFKRPDRNLTQGPGK